MDQIDKIFWPPFKLNQQKKELMPKMTKLSITVIKISVIRVRFVVYIEIVVVIAVFRVRIICFRTRFSSVNWVCGYIYFIKTFSNMQSSSGKGEGRPRVVSPRSLRLGVFGYAYPMGTRKITWGKPSPLRLCPNVGTARTAECPTLTTRRSQDTKLQSLKL